LSKQALAQIAKSGGLRFHSELPAVLASGKAAGGGGRRRRWVSAAGAFLPERGFVMPNRVDIDYTHSRAIVQEIGERMRASLKPEPELPARFKTQIDRCAH
jgi:predicted nucleotidyltransferase